MHEDTAPIRKKRNGLVCANFFCATGYLCLTVLLSIISMCTVEDFLLKFITDEKDVKLFLTIFRRVLHVHVFGFIIVFEFLGHALRFSHAVPHEFFRIGLVARLLFPHLSCCLHLRDRDEETVQERALEATHGYVAVSLTVLLCITSILHDAYSDTPFK